MIEWYETVSQNWSHYIPFAAVLNTRNPVPENRPATTRLIEHIVIAVLAAAISSYVMLQLDHQEISDLKTSKIASEQRTTVAIQQSEARVTAQIAELRAFIMIHKLRDNRN